MAGRLPTGIGVLDRKLDGGLPAGSIVALLAAPSSQSELLLYEFTAARGTLYLTTQRSQQSVLDGIKRSMGRVGRPTVRDVGGDAPLDHAGQMIRALPENANLIIDTADVLERQEPARYRNFMNELQTQMVNTGGIAILHCLNGRSIPDLRDTTEHMADVIFDLRTELKGDKLENRLSVPKFRGGRALAETVKLQLTEKVTIDTSRDIA